MDLVSGAPGKRGLERGVVDGTTELSVQHLFSGKSLAGEKERRS